MQLSPVFKCSCLHTATCPSRTGSGRSHGPMSSGKIRAEKDRGSDRTDAQAATSGLLACPGIDCIGDQGMSRQASP